MNSVCNMGKNQAIKRQPFPYKTDGEPDAWLADPYSGQEIFVSAPSAKAIKTLRGTSEHNERILSH